MVVVDIFFCNPILKPLGKVRYRAVDCRLKVVVLRCTIPYRSVATNGMQVFQNPHNTTLHERGGQKHYGNAKPPKNLCAARLQYMSPAYEVTGIGHAGLGIGSNSRDTGQSHHHPVTLRRRRRYAVSGVLPGQPGVLRSGKAF